jgi:hypothetical protein
MRLKLKKSPGPDSGASPAITRQRSALPALISDNYFFW